jgi:peptidoglycan L-alanyl-D-glutamate endopeptidase CwlK
MFSLGPRSKMRLKGVHPDLVKLVERAIQVSDVDFTVLEGLRSIDRQRELVKAGASQTLKSRHLTGHAVDLGAWVDNQVDWSWPLYSKINLAMLAASIELQIPIEWGGNWKTFKDGPHWQLPWKEYP